MFTQSASMESGTESHESIQPMQQEDMYPNNDVTYMPIHQVATIAAPSEQRQNKQYDGDSLKQVLVDLFSRKTGKPLDKNAFKHLELYYDLFFVANLTVFTNVHEVNDVDSLLQYIGFFFILWVTWYQVCLYDVQHGVDCVFERVARYCHFGVMIGIAVSGPDFLIGQRADSNSDDGLRSYHYFGILSLVLMSSRLVLFSQYVRVCLFEKKTSPHKLAFRNISVMVVNFAAAMIYLGIYFAIPKKTKGISDTFAWIGWHVVMGIEAIFITIVNIDGTEKPQESLEVSQKTEESERLAEPTTLEERMSDLTLIILGEGIIGLAERCQRIVQSRSLRFDSSVVGSLISALLILYLLYQLYFDWNGDKKVVKPTLRLQWAVCHVALHLTLVLAVESISQMLLWDAAQQLTNPITNELIWYSTLKPYDINASTWNDLAGDFGRTAKTYVDGNLLTITNYKEANDSLQEFVMIESQVMTVQNGSQDHDSADNADCALYQLYNEAVIAAFESAGFTGNINDLSSDENNTNVRAQHILQKFTLTYVYSFTTLGLYVLINAGMVFFRKEPIKVPDWVRLCYMAMIGLGLSFMACLAIGESDSSSGPSFNAWEIFISSSWILPTIALLLFSAVALNNTSLPVIRDKKQSRKDNSLSPTERKERSQSV